MYLSTLWKLSAHFLMVLMYQIVQNMGRFTYRHSPFVQDDEWEEIDDNDEDEDEDERLEAMTIKSSNGSSSVFKPLSDMQHLLTEEVSDFRLLAFCSLATVGSFKSILKVVRRKLKILSAFWYS